MKRLLAYLFLSFLIFIPKSFSKSYGEGDLKLSDGMIRYFHQYLKGKGNERPLMFSIAVDGSYAIYWYCPAGQCSGTNPTEYNKICSREAGVQCKIFAKGKYIKWKNGINVGKGKASKINSKQSFSDLKARLTELGFVGNVISEKEQVAKVQKAEEEKKKKAEEEKKKKAEEEKKRLEKEKLEAKRKADEEKKKLLEKEKLEAKRKADEEKKKLLEEKIKQQKALDEKKLSLLPVKPVEEKAKKALIDIQKFIKNNPDEFDILEISEFFIKTKPILENSFNEQLEKDLNSLIEYVKKSEKYKSYLEKIEIKEREKNLEYIEVKLSLINEQVAKVTNFLYEKPNSIHAENWLNSVKKAKKKTQ